MGSSVAKCLLVGCRFGVLVEHFRKPRNQPAIGFDGRHKPLIFKIKLKRDLVWAGPVEKGLEFRPARPLNRTWAKIAALLT